MSWEPDTSRVRLGDRALFPELAPFAYLNHAAISPMSSEVKRGVGAMLDQYATDGLGAFFGWRDQRERLRSRVASFIGAEPDEIALMPSTTRAVVDTALCLPWKPGDRIVCFRGEFPTNVTPWQRAAETFGLEVVMLDAEAFRTEDGLHALREELSRGVRLVAVSAVQFQTGLRMPVREISALAHAAGAEVFVDAIQAVGVVPLDVREWGVDYLACGAHKWLMGAQGAAFLYVSRDRHLVPRVAGWLSHEEGLRFLFDGSGHLRYNRPFRREAAMLESGSVSGLGFAALEASLACIMKLGAPAIYAHVQSYHEALEPALLERGFVSERHPVLRSGTLSVRPPEGHDLAELASRLGDLGVACTTPDGRLRFSPHWPNSLDEVPRVIAAIDASLDSS